MNQARYGNTSGVGRRMALPTEVEKIDTKRAYQLSRSFAARGKEKESRRAYQVMARAERGPKEQREHMAGRSVQDIESSERQGLTRAARRRGVSMEDINREIFARSAAGRAGRPNPWVNKAYDAEHRRQRRYGMAEATLGLAGVAAGARGVRGIRRTTRAAREAGKLTAQWKNGKEVTDALSRGVTATRRDLGLAGGGAAGLAGAGLVRAHAEGRRGRAYN